MDVALLELVGAGLATYAAGAGIAVPAGGMRRGHELVLALTSGEDPGARDLVERLIGEMLEAWQLAKIPTSIVEHHIAMLPGLIDLYRPAAAIGAEVVSAAHAAPDSRETGARLLAMATISEAGALGALERVDLTEAAALRTLEQLYRHLLAACTEIEPLLPEIAGFFAAPAAEASTAVGAVAAAPEAAAMDEVVPEPSAVPTTGAPTTAAPSQHSVPEAAIRRDLDDHLGPARVTGHLLAASFETCRSLLADLAQSANGIMDAVRARQTAGERLAEGDFTGADRCLTEAEDHEIRMAQTNIDLAGFHLQAAAEARSLRGRLDDLRGDFRRAARHYYAAARCLPMSDHLGRSRMHVRQALVLMKQGEHLDDHGALEEAASVFDAAANAGLAQSAPQEWADVQLMLAQLLSVLGEREQSLERFAAAVDHARAGMAAFAEDQPPRLRARAHVVLGDALHGIGDRMPSPPHLREALESYAAAIATLGAEHAAPEWAVARCGLGLTRLRLGDLEASAAQYEECLTDTGAALTAAEAGAGGAGLDVARLHAARGRALFGLFALRDRPALARDAADAFAKALESIDAEAGSTGQHAIRHRLALALWVMGERSGDVERLGQAAQELLAVLDRHERTGDAVRAEEVREDLIRLHDDMARVAAAGDAAAGPQDSARA